MKDRIGSSESNQKEDLIDGSSSLKTVDASDRQPESIEENKKDIFMMGKAEQAMALHERLSNPGHPYFLTSVEIQSAILSPLRLRIIELLSLCGSDTLSDHPELIKKLSLPQSESPKIGDAPEDPFAEDESIESIYCELRRYLPIESIQILQGIPKEDIMHVVQEQIEEQINAEKSYQRNWYKTYERQIAQAQEEILRFLEESNIQKPPNFSFARSVPVGQYELIAMDALRYGNIVLSRGAVSGGEFLPNLDAVYVNFETAQDASERDMSIYIHENIHRSQYLSVSEDYKDTLDPARVRSGLASRNENRKSGRIALNSFNEGMVSLIEWVISGRMNIVPRESDYEGFRKKTKALILALDESGEAVSIENDEECLQRAKPLLSAAYQKGGLLEINRQIWEKIGPFALTISEQLPDYHAARFITLARNYRITGQVTERLEVAPLKEFSLEKVRDAYPFLDIKQRTDDPFAY